MIVPLRALAHRPGRRVREHEHGAAVDVEQPLLVGHVGRQEPAAQPEAGVVDQDVDRPARVGQAVGDALHRRPVGEVGREGLDLAAVGGAQLVGHGVEALLVAGHEHEVVAVGGEAAGEREADAGRGAGDEGGGHGRTLAAGAVTARR